MKGSGHSIPAGPLSLSRAWGLGVIHVAVREPGEGIQTCLDVVDDAAKRRQRFQICFLETTPLVDVDDIVGLFRSEGELLAQMSQNFLSAALFFVRFHNDGARLGAVAIVQGNRNLRDIGALQQERGVQNFRKSGESRGQNVKKNLFAGFFIPQVGAGVGPEIAVLIVPDDDDGHARRWAELGPSDCATVGRGLNDFLNTVLDDAFDRDVLDGGANGAARNERQLDSGMRSDVVVEERDTRVASIRHHLSLNNPEAEKLTKSHDANVITHGRGETHGSYVIFIRGDSGVLGEHEILGADSAFAVHEVELNVFSWRERVELKIWAHGQRGIFELVADESAKCDGVGHGVEGS